jgi:hypothetical protein
VTIFCPDGYVPTPEAIYRAAARWFREQMAAIERATGLQSKTKPDKYIEAAWLSLRQEPPELQHEFQDILNQTVQRLRNLLHQSKLNAFYFKNFGRVSVSPHFWATTGANGVMEVGIYRTLNQLPLCYGFALLLLQSELDELLSEQPAKKWPFPEPKISELAAAMRNLDGLNRAQQREALGKSREFERYHITDRQFRLAEKQMPRRSGRKRLRPEQ